MARQAKVPGWLTPLSPAEQKIVEDNMGMVWWEVRRARPHDDNEAQDWAQDAIFGLIKAVRTFDPTRSSWSTWAYWCIRSRLYQYKKREGVIRLPRDIAGHDQWKAEQSRRILFLGSAVEQGLLDELVGKAPKQEIDDELIMALRYLHQHERDLLDMRYGKGLKIREIAAQVGISHQRVYQKIKKALTKLRNVYERRQAG